MSRDDSRQTQTNKKSSQKSRFNVIRAYTCEEPANDITVLTLSDHEKVQKEIDDYVSIDGTKCGKIVIIPWWTKHKDRFPLLHKVAMLIHSIPASSGKIESNFSVASFVLDGRRWRLQPNKLEHILLCNNNQDLLNK